MKKRFVVLLHISPAIISLLLIGAHFLRSGNFFVAAISLLLAMALCIREPLIARTAQVALFLATAEWAHVAFTLVSARLEAGLPWTKLAIILGAVAALSLASLCLFFTAVLKDMYHLSFDPAENTQNRMPTHDNIKEECSSTTRALETEQRQKLLAVHYLKSTFTSCSLLAFLLMDYSTLLGMVTLIAIGLTNSSLRTKMQGIGGILPQEDRKKIYTRQTLGLCVFAVSIIGYYSFSLPAIKLSLIVGSIITAYTLILWAMARYEYLDPGAKPVARQSIPINNSVS